MASMATLNNQRVSHNEQVLFENTIFAGQAQMSVPSPTGWGPRFRSRSVAEQKSDWILWFMVDFKLYLMGFINQIIAKLP